MSEIDPAFEKRVRLKIQGTTSEIVKYAQEIAADIPGIIDVKFANNSIIFHYNNNMINIDNLVEFMLKVNIQYSNCLMNRLKIALHGFVDANAKSNALAKPGCCAAAHEICKTVERNELKK